MVLFFARVLDLEVHHRPSRLQSLLPHGMLEQYRKRIGAANILDPIQPDGLYDLDLRVPVRGHEIGWVFAVSFSGATIICRDRFETKENETQNQHGLSVEMNS
jgi:hypothetical protein